MESKRKGYKNIKQQLEADKRYLQKNPQAKERRKRIVAKSQAKKFISEFATIEELEELKELINNNFKKQKEI